MVLPVLEEATNTHDIAVLLVAAHKYITCFHDEIPSLSVPATVLSNHQKNLYTCTCISGV